MMKFTALMAVVLFVGVAVAHPTYEGEMSGSQCVPQAGLQGGSWGQAGLLMNWDTNVAYLHIVHSLVASSEVAAIGVPTVYIGFAGTNGEPLFEGDFTTDGDIGGAPDSGVSPVVARYDFSGDAFLDDQEQVNEIQLALAAGRAYVSIGATLDMATEQPYENCAIRGQLAPVAMVGEGVENFLVVMTGSQEVPPNNSNKTGSADIYYGWENSEFVGNWQKNDDDDDEESTPVTGVHLHFGVAGENNALKAFVWPNAANDVSVFINAYTYRAMRAAATYVNVHTERFPTGEMRGQTIWYQSQGSSASTLTVGFGAVLVLAIAALF